MANHGISAHLAFGIKNDWNIDDDESDNYAVKFQCLELFQCDIITVAKSHLVVVIMERMCI